MKLRIEAGAKRWEREHNGRLWLAWHTAAFQRAKKLPDLKKMMLNQTSKPRQHWRQQLQIMTQWATRRNAELARLKEMEDGR